MSDWANKKFWTNAEAVPTEDGFTVELDGRPLRTPVKTPLIVPTIAAAEAIAAEWQAQDAKIDPLTMPVTRAANAAIDKVAVQQPEVIELLAAYGDTDLLCYRAPTPDALVQRQAELWDPMLEWAANQFGARLNFGHGIVYVPQDPEQVANLSVPLNNATNFELAALHDLISMTGSLVLGLAATFEDHDAASLWRLSRVDELWQEEQWGRDDEAAALALKKQGDFNNAHRFYRLVQKIG